MSLSHRARKIVGLLVGVALVSGALYGCAGPTNVETQPQSGEYSISMEMDPQTLNPPQRGTLSYEILDLSNKSKPVANFTPVYGALAHSILMTTDLAFFNHTYLDRAFLDPKGGPQFSLPQFWPTHGSYYSFALFQPKGADMQTFRATITSGQSAEARELKEDTVLTKTFGGVQVQLLRSPAELKAGQPSQLVFHVSERGNPVSGLWPFLDAPGHLWVIDEHGKQLEHETGMAEGRRLLAEATATATTFGVGPSETATARPSATATALVPTIAPEIVSTIEAANPASTLAPVAQTAQVSVMETSLVQPEFGYGPDVIFTHTFPEAGVYKMWVELFYRNQPITVDFTVRVTQ